MRGIVILIAALCVAVGSAAKGLTGKVVDENGEPLEFANVRAMRDSAFIAGQTTDVEGLFRFVDLPSTANRVEVAIVGYERLSMPIGPSGDMGRITMRPASNTLSEVEVKAERPKTRLSGNALVTSVENTILSTAGSGDDVLQNIPMLQGGEGSYTVFGNDGSATIYINGRQVRNANDISQLSSSDIKEVQVISNPGARYGGDVKGIIKIITKRPVGEGFGLKASTSNRYNGRFMSTNQIDVNYRVKGLDLFAQGFVRAGQSRMEDNDSRWYEGGKPLFLNYQTRLEPTTFVYTSGKIGANYQIGSKHNVGAYYEYEYYSNPNNYSDRYIIQESGMPTEETTSRKTGRYKVTPMHTVNAYYNGTIGKFSIEGNIDYLFKQTLNDNIIKEHSNLTGDRTVTTYNRDKNSLFAEKLTASYKLPAGSVTIGEEYIYTRSINGFENPENILTDESSRLSENNMGIFADADYSVGKFSFSAGLRYEHVWTNYLLNGVQMPELTKKYDHFYPSVWVSYSPGDFRFSLSYSEHMYRPSFSYLYSNYTYQSRVAYWRGNPYLQPEKSSAFGLQASWKFINFGMQFDNQRDPFVQVFEPYNGDDGIQVRTFANKPHFRKLSAQFSVSPTIGIWNPDLSLSVIKPWFEIEYLGSMKKMNQPRYNLWWKNTFTLPWDIVAEATFSWQSSGNYLSFYMKPTYNLGVRVYKMFLDKSLTVYLSGDDLLDKMQEHTFYYSGVVRTDGIVTYHRRAVTLTVRYNFNASRSRYKGTGAGQSEKSRL